MRNPSPRSTHRRWAIFYGATAALLAGWLLFEKMPDGREELAGSVEGTFWRSGEVMEPYNRELLENIQDGAEDYPSQQSQDYAARAAKAVSLAMDFEKKCEMADADALFAALGASFLMLADSDAFTQGAVAGFVDTNLTNQYLDDYKDVKASQLRIRAKGLVTWTLNYFATKVGGTGGWGCFKWAPAFLPNVYTPMLGEPFQVGVVLTQYDNPRCATFTCFFNDQPIPIKDGIATIRTTFPTPGPHTLRLRFRRERCRDGSVTEVSRDFKVNVLERCD